MNVLGLIVPELKYLANTLSAVLNLDVTIVDVDLKRLVGTGHLKDKVGDFDSELIEEFFFAFTRSFPLTLHIKKLEGKNTHHILEAIFKAFARSLKEALTLDPEYIDEIPSSKGML